jgi:hypothetical protein
VAFGVLAGCTWTPYATTETSAAAKQFTANPDAATIYVYRSGYSRPDENSILYMDGLVVGSTRPGTFYRIETVPARHVFHGIGLDPGYAAVDARAGQIYFVRLDVIAGQSQFKLQPQSVGRQQVISCCEMLDTWPWAHLSSR